MVEHPQPQPETHGERRYRSLVDTVFRLYDEGRRAEALSLLGRNAPGLPERRADTAHLTACLLALLGRPEDALRELSDALADGAWWSPALLTEDDDLAGLRALPGFDTLLRESADRHAAVNGTPLPPVVRRPATTPRGVLIALHGADQDAARAARDWAAAVDAGFVLVAVDSSQRSTPRYRSWPDAALALRDIDTALTGVDEAGGALPLLAAGFSAGGRIAVLWARSDAAVRPDGFLVVGPALAPHHLRPGARTVRGRILLGEEDEDVSPGARDAHRLLVSEGADVTWETIPGLGHALPADLPHRLPVLLDGLLRDRSSAPGP